MEFYFDIIYMFAMIRTRVPLSSIEDRYISIYIIIYTHDYNSAVQ